MHRSRGIHTCIYIDTHESDHPRSRWSLASTQKRKRTRLNLAVYIWKCVSSLLSILSSPVFVTQSIANDRNRNVKLFDPSRDASIFHPCPKNAPRPFSREKSHISVDQGYMECSFKNFEIQVESLELLKKELVIFTRFSSYRKLVHLINFKIIRLKIINLYVIANLRSNCR